MSITPEQQSVLDRAANDCEIDRSRLHLSEVRTHWFVMASRTRRGLRIPVAVYYPPEQNFLVLRENLQRFRTLEAAAR